MDMSPRDWYPEVAIVRPEIKLGKVQWAIGTALRRLARDARFLRQDIAVTPAAPVTTFTVPAASLPDPNNDQIAGVHRVMYTNSVPQSVILPAANERRFYAEGSSQTFTAQPTPNSWFSKGDKVTLYPPVSDGSLVYTCTVSWVPGGDDPTDRTYTMVPDAQEAIVAMAKALLLEMPPTPEDVNYKVNYGIVAAYKSEYARYMANVKNIVEMGETGDVFIESPTPFAGYKRGVSPWL